MELILMSQLYFWKLEKKNKYIPGFILKRIGSAKIKMAVALRGKKNVWVLFHFLVFQITVEGTFMICLCFLTRKYLRGRGRERDYGKVWYTTLSICHGSSNIMLSLEALGNITQPLPGVISLPCCTVIHI